MDNKNFSILGKGVAAEATTATGLRQPLGSAGSNSTKPLDDVLFVNLGTDVIYVEAGGDTVQADATSQPIMPGEKGVYHCGAASTHISVLAKSGAQPYWFQRGRGA